MLPIARAIIEDVKVAVRAERAQVVLSSVCQVLCLLQTWASSLQHFASLLRPLNVDSLAFPALASDLVQAAAQLAGAHALNDLTVLQTADLPNDFEDQVNEDQRVLRDELAKLPRLVADHMVQMYSMQALEVDRVIEAILSTLHAFIAVCYGDRPPNQVVQAIADSLAQIRVLVVEFQCREFFTSSGKARVVIPSAGS